MADFVSDFWSYYVIALSVFGIVFCLFVLISNSRRPEPAAASGTVTSARPTIPCPAGG